MQKFSNYFLSIGGALLLWAAWPTSSFTFIIFFAFIPLLAVENNVFSSKRFFGYTYLHMLVWNALTTWWIYNASAIGAAMAIFLNSLIMCVPWVLARWVKNKMGRWAGYLSLIAFWLSFEFFHHRWELSWPWLTLGNSFAMQPNWVQWYSATGTTGGSLWVLLTNILAYITIAEYRKNGRTKNYFVSIASLFMLLIVPILVSKSILNSYIEINPFNRGALKNVVVVQPNIDPYDEKFTEGSEEQQIQKLLLLTEQKIDTNTALVVWPETAIADPVWENEITTNYYYLQILDFLKQHSQLSILTGMSSYKNYGSNKKNATATSRFSKSENFYYDAFNSALMIRPDGSYKIYHKAKLVPGAETLPSVLFWLGGLFENFGGISGTLGRDKERMAIPDAQHYYVAAPVICYESIYSDYITGYIRKGANLLTIMTNDGWWDNTQGHKQHMNYARLRAIETRRWIARSANTGISCFIDPIGRIHQPQPWDTMAAIKMNIEPLQKQTFFVQHGDYISRIFNIVSILFLLSLLFVSIRQRFTK